MSGPDDAALAVLGHGRATANRPVAGMRNGPSFYADPAAWLVVAAVADALAGCAAPVLAAADEVGIVVVSRHGTAHTMRAIAGSAAHGMVSPLRFAGANPGVLAGLPCITWRLRGPSLALAMPPAAGLDVAVVVAASWLRWRQAQYVLLATVGDEPTGPVARCAVTAAPAGGSPASAGELPALLLPPEPATPAGGPSRGRRPTDEERG